MDAERKGDDRVKKSRLQWMSEQELQWYCWQYNDKLTYIRTHTDDTAVRYMRDVNAIDTALHMVSDGCVCDCLKKHIVNRNMPYERLGTVPMGRRQFYDLRTEFYNVLAKIR